MFLHENYILFFFVFVSRITVIAILTSRRNVGFLLAVPLQYFMVTAVEHNYPKLIFSTPAAEFRFFFFIFVGELLPWKCVRENMFLDLSYTFNSMSRTDWDFGFKYLQVL